MVNRSRMTCRCAAANSCGVWNKEEEKEEEESVPGEAASSRQPRLGARAAAAAAFQSQMSLINSSASQFIPILGDQTRKGELQKLRRPEVRSHLIHIQFDHQPILGFFFPFPFYLFLFFLNFLNVLFCSFLQMKGTEGF